MYSLLHFRQIWATDHTLWRKILLHIEFVYQFVSLLFTYFSLVSESARCVWRLELLIVDTGQLLLDILFHRRLSQ